MSERQTLGEFHAAMASVPGGARFIERISASSFEQFISLLHEDINDIVREMEANPDHHQNSDEDGLTYFVEALLKQRSYRASKGARSGGSIDLTVTGRLEGFSWIAEAKIFTSIAAVREGFLQLHTRYRCADIEKAKVGMLVYIKREHPRRLMDEWRGELKKMDLIDLSFLPCPTRPQTAFLTIHSPTHSDIATETRHVSVSLYHKPLDKSGRRAKKYKGR
jgi:hypothetical protein